MNARIPVALMLLGWAAAAGAAERLQVQLREPAGLARRGYPAHGRLTLPHAVPATTKFRLLADDQPIVAQFRPHSDSATATWWLDFQTELRPRETRTLVIEYGDDVTAGPERATGHRLGQTDTHFTITNAPYITWTVPRDLQGFLKSVDFAPSEFVRSDSPGLVLRDRQGGEHAFAGQPQVLRQGTMAVGLQFAQNPLPDALTGVRSTVALAFPAPVSWVEVDWQVDDPRDALAALGLRLNLNLAAPTPTTPTLVDFGATSCIYAALRPGQFAALTARFEPGRPATEARREGRAWEVVRGEAGRTALVAAGQFSPPATVVEGWAHVMDRQNCLALAVADFARSSHDAIRAGADGQVELWREFGRSPPAEPKRLRFWLHFVFFPPQASAAASPQQMQAPLELRQLVP